ncbi:hypothetical protein L1987_01861 [Smallanthus sonchifolius]|uniref:Uncharacterized protein n=1 Tax=Smallanthus sonchifolius TaxID=185202 RepID=A0ACB9K683_9ASTR|nr:hypothetical protein L1987_01861 [Smallanthus sonchifolius]
MINTMCVLEAWGKFVLKKLVLSQSCCEYHQPVTCLLHLKSSQEHTETESALGICLRPRTSDSHDFSIDVSSVTAAVYNSELCKQLKGFLATWPPSSPQPYVNELLIAH